MANTALRSAALFMLYPPFGAREVGSACALLGRPSNTDGYGRGLRRAGGAHPADPESRSFLRAAAVLVDAARRHSTPLKPAPNKELTQSYGDNPFAKMTVAVDPPGR
jgi:hypothetical protein